MSRNKPTGFIDPLIRMFRGTATRGAPRYKQGDQECERRRRQSAAGQLTKSNGLVP